MKDKLAEKILDNTTYGSMYEIFEREELIKAMQAYHESMMKTTVRKCASCDAPLNDYCERCQHQLES